MHWGVKGESRRLNQCRNLGDREGSSDQVTAVETVSRNMCFEGGANWYFGRLTVKYETGVKYGILAPGAGTKHHGLGGLNRHVLLYSSRDWKPKVKAWSGWLLRMWWGRGHSVPLPGSRCLLGVLCSAACGSVVLTSPVMFTQHSPCACVRVQTFPLHKGPCHVGLGAQLIPGLPHLHWLQIRQPYFQIKAGSEALGIATSTWIFKNNYFVLEYSQLTMLW